MDHIKTRASAIIIRDGQLLMMHRKRNGKEYWVLPGGAIESDEDPAAAAVREVKEETGLTVQSCKLAFSLKMPYYEQDWENCPPHPFFICQDTGGEPVLGGEEAQISNPADWYHPEWVSLDRLDQLTVYPQNLKQLLAEHEDKQKYL